MQADVKALAKTSSTTTQTSTVSSSAPVSQPISTESKTTTILYGSAKPGVQPKFLFNFGSQGEGDGQFHDACCCLAINPHDDTIWTGDHRGCQIFSQTGQFLRHAAKGQFKARCGGICFDNGEVFMADHDGHRVVVCRPDGSFVRSFGSRGAGADQYNSPNKIVADGNGLLFIADSSNERVKVVRRDGSFVRAFGSKGSGDGQFSTPYALAVRGSELWVTDYFNNRIQVLCFYLRLHFPFDQIFETSSGKFLRKFGSSGSAPGQFNMPSDVTFDNAGNALDCDRGSCRVQIFRPDGSFLAEFGKRGSGDGGFSVPYCARGTKWHNSCWRRGREQARSSVRF